MPPQQKSKMIIRKQLLSPHPLLHPPPHPSLHPPPKPFPPQRQSNNIIQIIELHPLPLLLHPQPVAAKSLI